MTGKKLRRVGSAFVDLDPLDVIRATDQKSRQMAPSVQEARNASRDLGTGTTTEHPAPGAEQTWANTQNVPKQDGKLADNSLPVEDLPESVEVIQTAGAIKHADTNIEQPELKAPAKDNELLTAPRLDGEFLNGFSRINDDGIQTAPRSVGTSNDKSTSTSSRPKRTERKSYKDVDWYEDLRPTDDELSKVENSHGKSMGHSPDPDYASPRPGTLPSKRKGRQSGHNSSKQRRPIKRPHRSHSQRKAQVMQLPLTAAPEISHALGPPERDDEAHQEPEAKRAVSISSAHLPVALAKTEQDQDRKASPPLQHEVLVISTSPTKRIDESDSDHAMNEVTENGEQETKALLNGKAKSVGQKLADALQDADLSTRHHPVTNGLFSTQISQIKINHCRSSSNASWMCSSRESLEPTYLPPEFCLEQVQSIPFLAEDQDTSLRAPWHGDAEPLLQDAPRMIRASKGTDYTSLGRSAGPSGLSHIQKPHISIVEQEEAGNRSAEVCDKTETVAASARQATEHEHLNANDQKGQRETLHHGTSGVEDSSRSSSAATTDKITSSRSQDSAVEQTPESQKPLLTAQTPRRPIATRIPRSSIVDDNGTPRLITRSRTRHRQVSRSVGLKSGASESTSHGLNCAFDSRSDDYTPDNRPPLSKFHLDMLLEYGVEAEDLLRGHKRSAVFPKGLETEQKRPKASTKADSYTEDQLEARLLTSPKQTDTTSGMQKSNRSSERNDISTAALSSSQRTIDEVGLCGIKSSDRRRLEKLLSTCSSSESTSDHSSIGIQDDLESLQWISELQVAQKSAHNLLRKTNQVSPIACTG